MKLKLFTINNTIKTLLLPQHNNKREATFFTYEILLTKPMPNLHLLEKRVVATCHTQDILKIYDVIYLS